MPMSSSTSSPERLSAGVSKNPKARNLHETFSVASSGNLASCRFSYTRITRGPMKGLSLVAFLTQLEVGLTYSGPRVSDDNPFIESFFKSVKYRVGYPKVFSGILSAREWFARFIDWYNNEHRHSGIGYVTPHEKHSGADILIFERRQITLDAVAAVHP